MSLLPVGAIESVTGVPPTAYNLTNSLRFRRSASGYLSRTFGTPTLQNVFTYSVWVKRGLLATTQVLFGPSNSTYFMFNSSDQLNLTLSSTSAATSSRVFRDPAAWYHIVYTQNGATQTIYVNNESVATGTTSTTVFNSAVSHEIGSTPGGTNRFDGYMTEVNFVDGQALTPSSFGETDATTGVWKPKDYTGTYGTNGFHLNFADNSAATAAAIGKDISGNSNNWTPTNISLTAGSTYDSMTDVPTLTSATTANYAVLNPLSNTAATPFTLSNANLNWSSSTSVNNTTFLRSTMAVSSGKWYWEVIPTDISGTDIVLFIGIQDSNITSPTGVSGTMTNGVAYRPDGQKTIGGTTSTYGSTYANNNVIGVALDMDAGTLTFYKNNVSQGVASSSLSGLYTPTITTNTGGVPRTTAGSVNFGQRPFVYTPPTGFVRLNTYNLPTSTIVKGNSYMDANTYTGTNASLSITNASAFRPDFVWIKQRQTPNGTDNALYDAVRGVTKQLVSNSTSAETTETQGLTAFNSNGFTLGTSATVNAAKDYVGWQWRAQGSTSTNSDGSIVSTVSTNTTAGFSIVTYTGNGTSTQTVGHGLGVAPKMIIVKRRTGSTTDEWLVWHTSIGTPQNFLLLNATNIPATSASNALTPNMPTSSVFYVAGSSRINANGSPYVAYCWAEIDGFSRFNSYTGNGSTNGPFVYTGFRPKFVMVKRTDNTTAANWYMEDSSRNTSNPTGLDLQANLSNAEANNSPVFDFLSNGFKLRTTLGGSNASAGTYLYMAFAENPFKNSLAR